MFRDYLSPDDRKSVQESEQADVAYAELSRPVLKVVRS
jgi:hypothetical protein